MSWYPPVGRRVIDRPAQRYLIGAGISDRCPDDRRLAGLADQRVIVVLARPLDRHPAGGQ